MIRTNELADRETLNKVFGELHRELHHFGRRVVLHIVIAVTAIVTAALLIFVCAFRLAG
jgi:hypothetical protein